MAALVAAIPGENVPPSVERFRIEARAPVNTHSLLLTVHQGDLYGKTGAYYINTVDEVTQFEIVGCVERINEAFLVPLLEGLLQRALPAGMYFALGRLGDGRELRTPLVIVR